MYVCMYLLYVWMSVEYARMYVCMYACMYVRTSQIDVNVAHMSGCNVLFRSVVLCCVMYVSTCTCTCADMCMYVST